MNMNKQIRKLHLKLHLQTITYKVYAKSRKSITEGSSEQSSEALLFKLI